MLVRRRDGLEAAPRRRAGRAGRPRRPRPRAPRGPRWTPTASTARWWRPPPARHRGAAARRGRAAARRLPRRRRRPPAGSAPGPRSAWPTPTRRRWRGCSTGLRGRVRPRRRARRSRRASSASARCSRRSSAATRRCSSTPGPRPPPRAARPPLVAGADPLRAAMHAAWHAFAVWGRPAHPRLRVCFAMLAGLGAAAPRAARSPAAGAPSAIPASSSTLVLRRRAPSTRYLARSASTGSSTAPTGPSPRPRACRSARPCGCAARAQPRRLLGPRRRVEAA